MSWHRIGLCARLGPAGTGATNTPGTRVSCPQPQRTESPGPKARRTRRTRVSRSHGFVADLSPPCGRDARVSRTPHPLSVCRRDCLHPAPMWCPTVRIRRAVAAVVAGGAPAFPGDTPLLHRRLGCITTATSRSASNPEFHDGGSSVGGLGIVTERRPSTHQIGVAADLPDERSQRQELPIREELRAKCRGRTRPPKRLGPPRRPPWVSARSAIRRELAEYRLPSSASLTHAASLSTLGRQAVFLPLLPVHHDGGHALADPSRAAPRCEYP